MEECRLEGEVVEPRKMEAEVVVRSFQEGHHIRSLAAVGVAAMGPRHRLHHPEPMVPRVGQRCSHHCSLLDGLGSCRGYAAAKEQGHQWVPGVAAMEQGRQLGPSATVRVLLVVRLH